jgi:type I restriction enzyme R subunit
MGILETVQAVGETELATRKMGDLLSARHGSLADAKPALGDVPAIRQAFVDVQRELYRH